MLLRAEARTITDDKDDKEDDKTIRGQVELFAKSPNIGTLSFSVKRLLHAGYGDNFLILDYLKNAQSAPVRR